MSVIIYLLTLIEKFSFI